MIKSEGDLIKFFKSEGVFDTFRKELYWRILRDKKELVLHPETHREFCSIYPEANDYILSNPLLGKKMKVMMWLLVHKMGFIVRFINWLRRMLRR